MSDLVKKPGGVEYMTPEEEREWLLCADPENGYKCFMTNYFYIQHPTKGQLLYTPFDYQSRLTETYHTNRFSIALMPRQTGKALPLTTKIPTPTGWTTMGDIKVGDEVIGKDGIPTRVVMATEIMHDHDCYEITFDTDHKIVADADHLWEVNTNDWRTGSRVVTTKELVDIMNDKRDDKAIYIEIGKPIECDEVKLPVDPYVLGKQNLKHIPPAYLRASIEQRLELLRGLMDTDGSVSKTSGSCEFYQKDIHLTQQVGELLSSLGIKFRISEKEIDNQFYHTIRFSTQLRVFNYEHSRFYIHSIEQVDSVPVRCIQVDNEDHMFLCSERMIPTHNSTSAAGYLLWYAMYIPDSVILIAAHKYSGAAEIMQRIRYAYELCPDHIRAGVVTYNKGSIEFDNGSRIVAQATTENTGRGMSITLLYCDEFAFVRNTIAEEFWTSMRPTLACVTPDTMILTNDGFIEIGDVFDHNDDSSGDRDVREFSVMGKRGLSNVSCGYVSEKSSTICMTNEHGMELEGTFQHPVYVASSLGGQMKPLEAVTENDYIRVDTDMMVFGKRVVDPNLAYMMGGYTAEGWSEKQGDKVTGITVSNTDAEFRWVFTEYGFKPRQKSSHKLSMWSKELCEEFEECGVDLKHRCHEKKIPAEILRSDKPTITAYLAGLFDGDGCVSTRSINLASTSKTLVRQVQMILLNLGIVSRVSTRAGRDMKTRRICENNHTTTRYRDLYSLNISHSQYGIFLDTIPIRIARKRNKLLEVMSVRKQMPIKQRTIPMDIIGKTCKGIIDRTATKHWYRKNGVRFDKLLDDKPGRKIPVDTFKTFSSLVKTNYEDVWHEYRRFFEEFSVSATWSRVKSCIVNKEKIVTYDLTVPTHTFLQNGMMASNTGGKCIITSTPNSDEDQFAMVWKQANKTIDEFGNENPNGTGVNGFKAFRSYWYEHPDRDEKWAVTEREAIGEDRFRREHGCWYGNEIVQIQGSNGEVFDISIKDLYQKLRNEQFLLNNDSNENI